jgi:PhzF family phenazine biosynthesis protein
MNDTELYHLAAFSLGASGGNPAGVWLGREHPSVPDMQQIAAEVGASETAFIAPTSGSSRSVRYFSPEVEVSFCGHATIASGVVLGQTSGDGTYTLETSVGDIEVAAETGDGQTRAALRSVETRQKRIDDASLQEALECLGWSVDDLDPSLTPVNAFAGAWHYVIAVSSKQTLETLDYDFERLKSLMQREGLTTLQLIWRENDRLFHSRNPFPVGGVVEDPATGAAAAALGGYLRDARLMQPPFAFDVLQGVVMGMPSRISVEVPDQGGILVRGTARYL